MPESSWLKDNVWADLCEMAGLEGLQSHPDSFRAHLDDWQVVFDSPDPHRMPLPEPFAKVSPLERLCILRCLRRDKIELAMQDFIIEYLDERFIQPPGFDLRACYNDSTTIQPTHIRAVLGFGPEQGVGHPGRRYEHG